MDLDTLPANDVQDFRRQWGDILDGLEFADGYDTDLVVIRSRGVKKLLGVSPALYERWLGIKAAVDKPTTGEWPTPVRATANPSKSSVNRDEIDWGKVFADLAAAAKKLPVGARPNPPLLAVTSRVANQNWGKINSAVAARDLHVAVYKVGRRTVLPDRPAAVFVPVSWAEDLPLPPDTLTRTWLVK